MAQEKFVMTRSNFILIMSDKNQELSDNNAFYEQPAIAQLKTALVPYKNIGGERRSIQSNKVTDFFYPVQKKTTSCTAIKNVIFIMKLFY